LRCKQSAACANVLPSNDEECVGVYKDGVEKGVLCDMLGHIVEMFVLIVLRKPESFLKNKLFVILYYSRLDSLNLNGFLPEEITSLSFLTYLYHFLFGF